MLLFRIFTLLQSWGAKPMDAVLLMITGITGYFLLKKADKKAVELALDKKADKDAVADLKDFINLRFDDIKTFLIELSKK